MYRYAALAGGGPVGVLGSGACVPKRVVTNDDIAPRAGVEPEWIARRTGILERRWAATGEATSDLAVVAAHRALENAGTRAADLGLILVATSTPDQPQPPTACFIQRRLGATRAAAFDLNAVCSGFVFAVSVACSMAVSSGEYVLVIGADVYSRILNPADRRTVSLFGDGAGAVVLGSTGSRCVLSTALHSFGAQGDLIGVPAGGSRLPTSASLLASGHHFFSMDGRGVRSFLAARLPKLVRQFLDDAAALPREVAHIIPHQANGVMLDEIVPELGLPNAAVHRTVERYGNTGAASVPITLDHAARTGAIEDGSLVLLLAFGGGMSAGMALLRW